eukprot:11102957-Alexandrium_andersonii.AAC.1
MTRFLPHALTPESRRMSHSEFEELDIAFTDLSEKDCSGEEWHRIIKGRRVRWAQQIAAPRAS